MECLVHAQNSNAQIWIPYSELRLSFHHWLLIVVNVLRDISNDWLLVQTEKYQWARPQCFVHTLLSLFLLFLLFTLKDTVVTFLFDFVGLCSQQYWRQSCCWVSGYESRGSKEEICFQMPQNKRKWHWEYLSCECYQVITLLFYYLWLF
jgi:hypothetical protein